VNVGLGEDSTRDEVRKLQLEAPGGEKIVILDSVWPLDDPEKKKSGLILSEQTNIALERCTSDWCIYLQADEVLHEQDGPEIRKTITRAAQRSDIDGVLLNYVHLYGSYDVIQETRSAYRREVRVVRKSSGVRSVGDAQSFRKKNFDKPRVLLSPGRVFHYGWVRTPAAMKEKTFFMDQLYHGEPTKEALLSRTPHTGENYRYKRFWGLKRFHGEHPKVMVPRIREKNWEWDFEGSPRVWAWSDLKKMILDGIEQLTGIRLFEYRSYRLIRD
jgi:glycosyltransferase involved in cell wall biosynthesis